MKFPKPFAILFIAIFIFSCSKGDDNTIVSPETEMGYFHKIITYTQGSAIDYTFSYDEKKQNF